MADARLDFCEAYGRDLLLPIDETAAIATGATLDHRHVVAVLDIASERAAAENDEVVWVSTDGQDAHRQRVPMTNRG